MKRGVRTALVVSCIALNGCTTASQEVKVRAIPDPASAFRGGDAVAVARGQLVLGNAGLALEGFRKAQRDNPNDPRPLAGIGDCYVMMGRFDIAQSNYEAALALAPHDPTLLLGLASIFEREGLHARAMAARAEAGVYASAHSVPAPPAQPVAVAAVEKPTAIPAPSLGSVTVELPAARPAAQLASRADLSAPELEYVAPATSVTVELPPARPASHLEARSADVPLPHLEYAPLLSAVTIAVPKSGSEPLQARSADLVAPELQYAPPKAPVVLAKREASPHLEARAEELPAPELREVPAVSSITVPLPPARPAEAPRPAPKLEQQALAIVEDRGPRLERLSQGEVALVTTGKSPWNAPKNVLASADSVKWVSLADASPRPPIQILNAARVQGIAASARSVLVDRGWRKLQVGDAPQPQQRSEVLYSKNRATLGRRLAAQFGVAARMVERDILVLVLGRDAADKVGQRGS